MRHSIFILAALFIMGIFSTPMHAQQELKEKKEEKKPDFATKTLKENKPNQATVVPDTYMVMFSESVLKPFVLADKKKYDSREAQGKAADAYEKQMIAKIKQIATKDLGITPAMIKEYYTTAFVGIKVELKNPKAKGLDKKFRAAKEKIAAVFPDFEVSVNTVGEAVPAPANMVSEAQTTSWGTNYVGSKNYSGVYWAWIIDTGIDLDHSDLNVVTSSTYAKSFVGTSTANDDNGHGSHCAGIVAAKNNSIGTKGVAAGARVVPIKVLKSDGRGSWSGIASGINHVAKYAWAKDVANLSLGGGAPEWPEWLSWWDDRWDVEDAVRHLASKGVYVVIAAGNDSKHAKNYTPARVNGTRIYTISAMDYYKRLASFSNYGNGPVDYAAPGVSILSCYKNNGYVYMNGTSMAAPHVAGILLAGNGTICTNGTLVSDRDGTPDRVAKLCP